MAFENVTMSEMMEALRKERQASEPEAEVFADETLYDYEETEQEPEKIDLDACLEGVMKDLSSYRLSQEAQQTVREFITFQVQTRQASASHPEVYLGRYNLVIYSDEKDSIRHVAQILRQALDIRLGNTMIRTEKELLQQLDGAGRSIRSVSSTPLIPNDVLFLVIDECGEAPRLSMEGGGTAREASKKAMNTYKTLWDTVQTHMREHPETILIVGSSEDVYRSTLRPFTALSQRICRNHIQLPAQTEEDLLNDCMAELRNSVFTLSDDLEPALKKYFTDAYRASELQGKAFVADVIGQLFTRYYSCKREELVLTADCVPKYDPVTLTAEEILGQLDKLVGLEAAKAEFRNIYRMQIAGLVNHEDQCYHMLFAGNPGTGKSTVARMAADLLHGMGVLKTNKLVTVKPSDLVSEWVGGTGIKAMEVIRRAYNGVLFVDEAYGIASMDRGEELLNVLLQEMENNSGKLVVIFAGYTEEMRELIRSNPGLSSRISREIRFEDYTQEELAQIFLQLCKKDGFSLEPSARDELDDCIGALMTREFFGNARDIKTMLQDLKEVWANDYYETRAGQGAEEAELERVFLPHHFEKIMPPKKEVSIRDLIGLDVLKHKLDMFRRQAMYQKYLKEKGFTDFSDFSMHMIFTGNPGTGKSTVAKLIADDLYSIGMLKTNRLIIAERKDLVSVHGDTAKKTADIIRSAVGGVLFIDEAYALADGRGTSGACIEVLLTAMEEHKSDTVFIFAGYVDEMQEFLALNPGILSRIGYTFHFDDYSPEELTGMYADKMKKAGFAVSEGALSRVREIMEYFQDTKNFGNGRFVNHVIHQTISQRANRDFTKQYRNIHSQDIPSIKTLIETAPNSMQLYDPATITPEQQRRTAVHELGHAIVMLNKDCGVVPERISIRNHAGSFGRVKPAGSLMSWTEQQMFSYIVALLSGKNAERLIFGSHISGCIKDYAHAKKIAADMVELYAMTEYGDTPQEILKAADKLSADTLVRYKDGIDRLCEILLRKKELTANELAQAMETIQT